MIAIFQVRHRLCRLCPTPCTPRPAVSILTNKCPLPEPRWPEVTLPRQGLGDWLAKFATPFARIIGLNCVDRKTGQLLPESGCARRKAALNRLTLPHA